MYLAPRPQGNPSGPGVPTHSAREALRALLLDVVSILRLAQKMFLMILRLAQKMFLMILRLAPKMFLMILRLAPKMFLMILRLAPKKPSTVP